MNRAALLTPQPMVCRLATWYRLCASAAVAAVVGILIAEAGTQDAEEKEMGVLAVAAVAAATAAAVAAAVATTEAEIIRAAEEVVVADM